METPHTDAVVSGGEQTTMYWWVVAPINRFVYEVYVVRYHEPVQDLEDGDSWHNWQEFLDENGDWHVTPEGGVGMPALTISQRLINAMGQHGPLERDTVAASLEALATAIFKRVDRDA